MSISQLPARPDPQLPVSRQGAGLLRQGAGLLGGPDAVWIRGHLSSPGTRLYPSTGPIGLILLPPDIIASIQISKDRSPRVRANYRLGLVQAPQSALRPRPL